MINQQEENNGSSGEFKRTPLAMVRPTLNLLLNTYYEKYPCETIEFLLGQYSIVSECDSNPNTGEVKQLLLRIITHKQNKITDFFDSIRRNSK